MYHVYILKSIKDPSKTYVGLTLKDPYIRLKEHNNGESQSTKHFRPWELIYYENFYCKLCADKREIFLKSGIGYRFRKIIVDNYRKLKY
jgi:putative endonuclease